MCSILHREVHKNSVLTKPTGVSYTGQSGLTGVGYTSKSRLTGVGCTGKSRLPSVVYTGDLKCKYFTNFRKIQSSSRIPLTGLEVFD
jgi:hypothetical protein